MECNNCKTRYSIKRLTSNEVPTFFKSESDRIEVRLLPDSPRTYLPSLSHESIEFETLPDNGIETPQFNPTICLLCKLPLQASLSVRVRKAIFIDYEDTEVIGLTEVKVVKCRPSYKIGRAHPHCAVSADPRKFELVDLRAIPDKRQRSMGSLENPRDKWKAIDPSESEDWE